ncbi:MAG: ATP-binding cassette domain-containing protein [Erysipelotrichaceae bacterium]|nr:ATP-binding cassette domain-containing protein [Erysipelotrichaceae bacterium]MDD3809732.1 ATP-binding cassette domain-containing protein [Erysipelotrichaceae bacterium]
MCLIRLEDINLRFDDNIIFDHFNLKVNSGDKILITGKSGRGKSTLLSILLGFVKADSGGYYFNGAPVSYPDLKKVRLNYAYVNQDVTIQEGIVREVLNRIAGFDHNNFNGVIDQELLEYFEFDESLFELHTSKLSGGQRQRLGLMIALSLKRDIFLLDEITSALDQELKDKTASYLANLQATVIVVSHDSCFLKTGKFKEVRW